MTNYVVIYEKGETGWGAYSPDLPGVYALGDSRAEVEQRMREAVPAHIAFLRESGLPVPEPHNAAGLVQVA